MGLEQADAGTFEVGETVKLAYVDQQHKDIDPKKTVYEVISQGNETIRMGGRDVNARAYISRFSDYRNVDAPTDVLSFALNEGEEDIPEEETELGDIVINLDRAIQQAKEFGHSTEREVAYLSVHGFLHILGYDHYDPEEKKAMRKAEEDILSACGITRMMTEGEIEREEAGMSD